MQLDALQRYQVIETISTSSLATVVKAYDKVMERMVAIKSIPASKKTAIRALREARTVALLNHPNIVTVYDFIETGNYYHLVMEYLEGLTLQRLIDQNAPIDIEVAVAIAMQVCRALENAHDNNIVHRDIKPDNILVLNSGLVKVMDFGVSKLSGAPITREGEIVGTFAYMSPEQATGQLVDERSDIWSTSVVLYQMLTGVNPFAASTARVSVNKILHTHPPAPNKLNPKIPQEICRTILKGLEKFPPDRFDLATDLRYKLQRHRCSTEEPPEVVKSYIKQIKSQTSKIDLASHPIAYLRQQVLSFIDLRSHLLKPIFTSLILSASTAYLMVNNLMASQTAIIIATGSVFISGLVFPAASLGLVLLIFFLSAEKLFFWLKLLLAAWLVLYWFGTHQKILPTSLPWLLVLPGVWQFSLAYPLGIGLLSNPGMAFLIAAQSVLILLIVRSPLKINFPIVVAPTILLLLEVFIWAVVGAVVSYISKWTSKLSLILSLLAGTGLLTFGYREIFIYYKSYQVELANLLKPITFSSIILLVLLLVFYRTPIKEK
jgi:serine/threonine protein kinase